MSMRTNAIRFAARLAALAPAGVALAAEEHAAEGPSNPMSFDLAPFIATLIVFGLVLFILSVKVWPAITKALDAREAKIRGDIEEAERARKQATASLQQYEKALAGARAEAARMLDEAKIEQQKLAADLRAKTERELNGLRAAAARDIDAAKRAAVTEIYGTIATTATEIAGKILQREIKPSDQQRLVEDSLGELESAGAG